MQFLLTLLVLGVIGAVIGLATEGAKWVRDNWETREMGDDWSVLREKFPEPSSAKPRDVLGRAYPHAAGARKNALPTSVEAAVTIEGKGRAATLRDRARMWFAEHEGTADDCAGGLGENVLAIRPRVAELYALGEVEPTGERRQTALGRPAMVMRLVRERAEVA